MRIDILGVKINKVSGDEAMEKIGSFLNSGYGHYVVTVNPEMVVLAQKDREFRDIINNADLAVPDGIGLVIASKIILWKKSTLTLLFKKREPLPYFSPLQRDIKGDLTERINGIDLIYKIAKKFDNPAQKIRIFFLGARGENAKLASQKIKKNFPHIEIAGFFGGDANEEGDKATVSIINQSKPNILFVAYGAPRQEKWIARNLKKIPTVRLAIGIGGAFDIISGKIARAPLWMRNAGLEWLWRFVQEPRRIGRIYNATIKFGWLVLTNKSKKDKI